MITISLAMIVKDEQDVLSRCLSSVHELVDEIIIVDTGSSDNTKNIARRFTDKVYDFKWIDDFSAARNYAFSLASQEYIMWLDADDYLKEEDQVKFVRLKNELEDDVDMVLFQYDTTFNEKGELLQSTYRERLVKRKKNYKWVEPVHETIPHEGNIKRYSVVVTHGKIKRHDDTRNLDILEKQTALSPKGIFNYARELHAVGRFNEAISKYEAYLDLYKNSKSPNKVNNFILCLYLIADCYVSIGDNFKALEVLYRIIELDANQPEACCKIAKYHYALADYMLAIHWYKLALTAKEDDGVILKKPDYGDFYPHLELSTLYFILNDYNKAYAHHLSAKTLKPMDESILKNDVIFDGLMEEINEGLL